MVKLQFSEPVRVVDERLDELIKQKYYQWILKLNDSFGLRNLR